MAMQVKWQNLSIKSTSHPSLTLDFDAELGKWKLMDAGKVIARRKNIRSLIEGAAEMLDAFDSAKAAKPKEEKADKAPKATAEPKGKKAKSKKGDKKAGKKAKPKMGDEPSIDDTNENAGQPADE